jgi:hypothetical protein
MTWYEQRSLGGRSRDYVGARSKGRNHTSENEADSCRDGHASKSDKTPVVVGAAVSMLRSGGLRVTRDFVESILLGGGSVMVVRLRIDWVQILRF